MYVQSSFVGVHEMTIKIERKREGFINICETRGVVSPHRMCTPICKTAEVEREPHTLVVLSSRINNKSMPAPLEGGVLDNFGSSEPISVAVVSRTVAKIYLTPVRQLSCRDYATTRSRQYLNNTLRAAKRRGCILNKRDACPEAVG